jgi:hypothetical protein
MLALDRRWTRSNSEFTKELKPEKLRQERKGAKQSIVPPTALANR